MKNDGNSTTDLSTQSGFFVYANALRCSRKGASDAVGDRGDDPGAWPYCFLSFASSSHEGHGDLLEQHGNSGWYKIDRKDDGENWYKSYMPTCSMKYFGIPAVLTRNFEQPLS
ncbi:hypothetical protein OsI_28272 [Oryza sativa Indica Group]|uniref:Uncharacterized protein n=1 Tax=Oryza sativa subsp. indica TaxID=39946 RepID=A2YSG7_ORYSI|nr:hypothetical protein OsI_28272 [Oryza sativa Indica Group]